MGKEWNYKVLAVCFALVVLVWAFGSIFTTSGVSSDWFISVKPAFMPPAWLFAPVWTLLYIMIAFSLYFAWNNAATLKQRKAVIVVFGANLLFNALWSLLFFGFQSPASAFIDILLLFITIIWAIGLSWKLDRKAAWLLVPYLLWVGFASVLTWASI